MRLLKAKKKVQKKPAVQKKRVFGKKAVLKKKTVLTKKRPVLTKKKPVLKATDNRKTKPLASKIKKMVSSVKVASKPKKKAIASLVTVKVLPELNQTLKRLETLLRKQHSVLGKQVQVLQTKIQKASSQYDKAVSQGRDLEQKMEDAIASNGKPVNQQSLKSLKKAAVAAEKVLTGLESDFFKTKAAFAEVEQELSNVERVKDAISSHRGIEDTEREEALI